jgi:hypothetical protein
MRPTQFRRVRKDLQPKGKRKTLQNFKKHFISFRFRRTIALSHGYGLLSMTEPATYAVCIKRNCANEVSCTGADRIKVKNASLRRACHNENACR